MALLCFRDICKRVKYFLCVVVRPPCRWIHWVRPPLAAPHSPPLGHRQSTPPPPPPPLPSATHKRSTHLEGRGGGANDKRTTARTRKWLKIKQNKKRKIREKENQAIYMWKHGEISSRMSAGRWLNKIYCVSVYVINVIVIVCLK